MFFWSIIVKNKTKIQNERNSMLLVEFSIFSSTKQIYKAHLLKGKWNMCKCKIYWAAEYPSMHP